MKKIIYGLLASSPVLALAQTPGEILGSGGLGGFGTTVVQFLNNTVIPVLFAVAIVYFIYGVVKFVMAAGDEEKVKEGKSAMIWGIIGLVVIISVFGLITFLSSATGLRSTGSSVTLPKVPTQ